MAEPRGPGGGVKFECLDVILVPQKAFEIH